MAKDIYFKGDDKNNINSFEPFQKEWEFLQEMQALDGKPKVLKSSNIEYFIPKAFRFVYILLFLLSFFSILFNFSKFITAFQSVLFVE